MSEQNSKSPRYVKGVYSLPLTFDPSQMNDTSSLMVSNLIYDGLLQFTAELELKPAIAESWTTSQDGKLITFKLRKSANFHDGTAITPEAVIQSFERVIGPRSKVYSYYDCIEGAERFHKGVTTSIAGIKVGDSGSIEIKLRYPFPPFLSVLAGATAKILPLNASTQPKFFESPVGSGPFSFTGIKKGKKQTDLLLSRFDAYYGDRPKIADLVLRVMSEGEALSQARAGLVHDLANFPLSGEEDIFKVGQDITSPVAATWMIGLNTRLAPFQKAEVRRTFQKSIDVEKFRLRFSPDAISANGYIPPGLPGFQSYRPEKEVIQIQRAPVHSLIRIGIPKLLARHMEMKEFLESSLQKQGWKVEVVPMEWKDLMRGYSAKSLQAFLISMNMDYPDTEFLVRNFESTNPDNFSGLKSRAVDALIHQARATQDRLARDYIYGDLVGLLNHAAVTVNLFHPRGHFWVHSCVENFEPNLLSDVYVDYRQVTLKKNCETEAGRGV